MICGMLSTKDVTGYLRPLAAQALSLHAVAIPGETATLPAEDTTAAAEAVGDDPEQHPHRRSDQVVVEDLLLAVGQRLEPHEEVVELVVDHVEAQVLELGGERDYRQRILEQAQVYHTPLGAQTDARMRKEFWRLANTEPQGPGDERGVVAPAGQQMKVFLVDGEFG